MKGIVRKNDGHDYAIDLQYYNSPCLKLGHRSLNDNECERMLHPPARHVNAKMAVPVERVHLGGGGVREGKGKGKTARGGNCILTVRTTTVVAAFWVQQVPRWANTGAGQKKYIQS